RPVVALPGVQRNPGGGDRTGGAAPVAGGDPALVHRVLPVPLVWPPVLAGRTRRRAGRDRGAGHRAYVTAPADGAGGVAHAVPILTMVGLVVVLTADPDRSTWSPRPRLLRDRVGVPARLRVFGHRPKRLDAGPDAVLAAHHTPPTSSCRGVGGTSPGSRSAGTRGGQLGAGPPVLLGVQLAPGVPAVEDLLGSLGSTAPYAGQQRDHEPRAQADQHHPEQAHEHPAAEAHSPAIAHHCRLLGINRGAVAARRGPRPGHRGRTWSAASGG